MKEWVDAAKVYSGMRNNRLGILGHYYGGMLDVYSDITLVAEFCYQSFSMSAAGL